MSKKQKKPLRSFDESVRAGAAVFVADALRRGFGGIGAAIKHPLVLLPAVILLLAQTALSVVKINAPDSTLVQILSLLTFAQGGMYAGFLGKAGGVIGKALLAGMITRLFMKNKGQKALKREKLRGGSVALLIPGLGAGLIVYNFLTGNACLENAMIGVTSAIAVFRMAGKPSAFLPGLLRSFRKGKTPAGAAKSVLTGVGAGLALGVLTSLRGGGYFCYALGAALLLIGLVLTLFTKKKRAVAVAAALVLCLSPLAGFVTTAQAAADSFTLTLDAIIDTSTDNREFESVGADHSSVTLTTGQDARLQCICNGGNGGNDWTYTYTFDFTWQGEDTWNCESTVLISIYENGVQLGDSLSASAVGELSLDGVSPGEKAEVSAAFISMENRGEAWGDVWFPHTASSRAVFAVSGGASLPAASGTWVLENTVYHGENGCGRTLNTPVVFDTVGKSTIMGWKFTNANHFDIPANVSVSNYPERIASGETFSIELGFHAHRASYACTWVGIDNCGMEQENFDAQELYDDAYGTLPKQGRLPKLVLETADGNNVICTWWDSFGTPENFAEYTDRSEAFSAVMPDGTSFSGRCSVYVGLAHTADQGELTPMVEFVYQWVPSGPAAAPNGEDADGDSGNGLFDEDGFFDGENLFGWDELSEHTDTEETLSTDAAAVAGGILAALLAAGGAMGGGFGGALGSIPPLPDSPYMRRDPDDPAYATLTGPGGVQSLYRYDEASGLWRDPYSDSYLEPGQIDRAMRDAESARAFSEQVIGQMENRTDAASMRQKQMYKMEQQENRLWAKGGGYDGAIESRLAKQLQDLRRQMVAGGELDVARYARVRDAIGKLSRGEIKNESLASAPPDDRWSPGEIKTAMEMTAREIGTGSSWKALALRGVLAVGTGGASEKVFDVTGALYDMHDAVMAGDDDATAFAKAVGNYMAGELVGDAAGAGLKKVGGAVADTQVGQKAMRAVGNLLDPAAKQADDAAKAAKRLSLVKNAEISTVGTAPKVKPEAAPKLGVKPQVELKIPQPKSKAPFDSLQSDKRLASVKQDAQTNIQKELDKIRAKRGTDPMQAAANQRAAGKVDTLQNAMEELKRDPQNPAKQKAAEQAAMAVQQDKAGIRQMKQGDIPAENRQLFNAMKTQKDQIATANTREILAKKYGVRPGQIQSIEPSNTMTTSELRKVGEADGIYRQPAAGSVEGAKRFSEHDFPLDAESASKTGVSSDIDKTMRVAVDEIDPRTGQTVTRQYDIPASEVKAVYEEEFYRSWHGGELPTKTVNGKTVPDTEAIGRFAKEMDVSCNDKVSTESYSDLVEAMKKNGVKEFSDVEATSLTTRHKSTEWFNRADALEQNAGGDLNILAQAENLRTEGIRQATKQFENLTMRQAREINFARKIEVAKVPDTLIQRMEVLKRVDMLPPEGISTKEAETILNGMGTSTEKTLEQFYAVTEMLNKWK